LFRALPLAHEYFFYFTIFSFLGFNFIFGYFDLEALSLANRRLI
jgi:hypothetical protein